MLKFYLLDKTVSIDLKTSTELCALLELDADIITDINIRLVPSGNGTIVELRAHGISHSDAESRTMENDGWIA